MKDFRFDPSQVEWIQLEGEPNSSHPVNYAFAVLGGSEKSGVLDMLVRFEPGGHCPRHRHVAPTSTLVLEGEQHLWDTLDNGETRHRVRRAGDYALSEGNDLHLEAGGPEGGLIYLSMHSRDGHLFDLVDEGENVIEPITIASLTGG